MPTPGNLHISEGHHGGYIAVTSALLTTWMLLFFMTRVYVRTHLTPWGPDDWALTASTVLSLFQVANVFAAVHDGLGLCGRFLTGDETEAIMQFIYISQILYIATICASKVSTALLISRLTRTDKHLKAARWIIHFTIWWSAAAILMIALRKDIHHPWLEWVNSKNGLYQRWVIVEVVGMVIEIGLVALAVTLVGFLAMDNKIKYVVVGAFSIRLLIIPPTILRLVYLEPHRNAADPTFRSVIPVCLTQICMHVSLITATVPCLKPFIAPFEADYDDDNQVKNRNNNNDQATPSRAGSGLSETIPGFMFRKPSSSRQTSERGSSVSYYNTEKDYRLSRDYRLPRAISRQSVQYKLGNKSKDINTPKQASPQQQEEWMMALANPGVGRPLMMRPDTLGFEVTVDSGSPSAESPLSPAETRVGNSIVTVLDEEEPDDMYIRRVKEVSVEYSYSNHV